MKVESFFLFLQTQDQVRECLTTQGKGMGDREDWSPTFFFHLNFLYFFIQLKFIASFPPSFLQPLPDPSTQIHGLLFYYFYIYMCICMQIYKWSHLLMRIMEDLESPKEPLGGMG